jgi:hypothetical protein
MKTQSKLPHQSRSEHRLESRALSGGRHQDSVFRPESAWLSIPEPFMGSSARSGMSKVANYQETPSSVGAACKSLFENSKLGRSSRREEAPICHFLRSLAIRSQSLLRSAATFRARPKAPACPIPIHAAPTELPRVSVFPDYTHVVPNGTLIAHRTCGVARRPRILLQLLTRGAAMDLTFL